MIVATVQRFRYNGDPYAAEPDPQSVLHDDQDVYVLAGPGQGYYLVTSTDGATFLAYPDELSTDGVETPADRFAR